MTPARRLIVAAALVVLVAGAGALAAAVRAARPAVPTQPSGQLELGLFRRAAESAQFRRVLCVRAEPGKEPEAHILASGNSGSGWTLYPVAPPGAHWMEESFDRLADAAARDYVADHAFEPDTLVALERFDVKLVVVHDGKTGLVLEAPRGEARLAPRSGVPALELRKASFVWQFLGERPARSDSPELQFAKGLRLGDAAIGDPALGLWSMAATIEAFDDAEYLFSLPAEGARITVDGALVTPRAASIPFAIVPVPKGSHRVEVTFGQDRGRDAFVIGAAAAVVASLIALLLALRPTPRLSDIEMPPGDA